MSEIDPQNLKRHEDVLKLLPEDSVYILLWGEPREGEEQLQLRALGNMTASARMRLVLSFVTEEIKQDGSGEMAAMLRALLTEQLEKMIGEIMTEKMMEKTPYVGN